MANPDRMFDDGLGSDKVDNWTGGILFFVFFALPLLYLIYAFIFSPESLSSSPSNTPDCQYYGDQYECD